MPAQPWRDRREAYLRERGRVADLLREGYISHDLAVVEGGGRAASPAETDPVCGSFRGGCLRARLSLVVDHASVVRKHAESGSEAGNLGNGH